MSEEIAGSPLEIKELAEKALKLQGHLLRRAWGVLYATWSISLFVTTFGAPISAVLLRLSGEYAVGESFAVSVLVDFIALIITLRAFKRVRDTAEIRSLVTAGKWGRVLGYRMYVSAWAAIIVALFLSIFLFGLLGHGLLLLLSAHVVILAYLYYALSLSFPEKLPTEGIAALSSFGVATAISIAYTLSFRIPAIYELVWATTIAILVFSALYARSRPQEDLLVE